MPKLKKERKSKEEHRAKAQYTVPTGPATQHSPDHKPNENELEAQHNLQDHGVDDKSETVPEHTSRDDTDDENCKIALVPKLGKIPDHKLDEKTRTTSLPKARDVLNSKSDNTAKVALQPIAQVATTPLTDCTSTSDLQESSQSAPSTVMETSDPDCSSTVDKAHMQTGLTGSLQNALDFQAAAMRTKLPIRSVAQETAKKRSNTILESAARKKPILAMETSSEIHTEVRGDNPNVALPWIVHKHSIAKKDDSIVHMHEVPQDIFDVIIANIQSMEAVSYNAVRTGRRVGIFPYWKHEDMECAAISWACQKYVCYGRQFSDLEAAIAWVRKKDRTPLSP